MNKMYEKKIKEVDDKWDQMMNGTLHTHIRGLNQAVKQANIQNQLTSSTPNFKNSKEEEMKKHLEEKSKVLSILRKHQINDSNDLRKSQNPKRAQSAISRSA